MKLFNSITKGIVLLMLLFVGGRAFAQADGSQGSITSVSNFSVHPYVTQDSLFNYQPGLCVMANFQTQEDTQVSVRYAPYVDDGNFTWQNGQLANISSPSQGLNLTALLGVQPATEYAVELMEYVDGNYYSITPENPADSLALICSPNSNGQMSPDCNIGAPVFSVCSPESLLPNDSFVTISNPVADTNTISFDVISQNINNEALQVLYTTDLSVITSGTLQGANVLTTEPVTSGQSITISIPGLLASTTYYITIINTNQQIVLGDSTYQTFTTGSAGSGGGGGNANNGTASNPGNININVNTSTPPELAGEEIQEGLVQCGFGEVYDCDFNKLLETIDRVLKFLIYIIVLPLAAILFAVAGIKLIIAREKGKEAAMSDAKTLFGNVVVGLALALGAWVIVKFILVILGYTDASGILTQILGITTQ